MLTCGASTARDNFPEGGRRCPRAQRETDVCDRIISGPHQLCAFADRHTCRAGGSYIHRARDCERVTTLLGLEFSRAQNHSLQRPYHTILVVCVRVRAVRHAMPAIHYCAECTARHNLPVRGRSSHRSCRRRCCEWDSEKAGELSAPTQLGRVCVMGGGGGAALLTGVTTSSANSRM